MFKTFRRSFAAATALVAVSLVPAMASQMPLKENGMHNSVNPNARIRLPQHRFPATTDSGAYGIGGAATPNVRCPPGANCLTP
ncbi:hypothetical protein [Bradyrhizobium iriomotense]|uniref:Uncharacterized protein n=1 Tax=Bradyrhizobium iriomotense TaxID=441950 RepID=A0ABQ6B5A8_9BRAD|nr:hypothetical protein [Bradyrhizobium iriomotense]GLR89572.1 hypothetical protein GCM10007857_62850 [Bradyrhizobium iriomotense]